MDIVFESNILAGVSVAAVTLSAKKSFRMLIGFRKAIVASLVLFLANASAEEGGPKAVELLASQESESYKLIKISNDDRVGNWDQNVEFMFIDLKQMKDFISADPDLHSDLVTKYIADLTDDFSTSLVLVNSIKREYNFSRYWTNPKNPINVESFQKLSYQSDLNEFLGPLAAIPTRVDGVARFNLYHNNETIQFLGFASKKVFSITSKYWAYFRLFEVQNAAMQDSDIVILVANSSDGSGYSGTYVLVPKWALDSEVERLN